MVRSAELQVLGPSALVLAQYLAQYENWLIDRIEQRTSMRGVIMGRHENPESYAGFGINDGTRIQVVTIAGEDETENPA